MTHAAMQVALVDAGVRASYFDRTAYIFLPGGSWVRVGRLSGRALLSTVMPVMPSCVLLWMHAYGARSLALPWEARPFAAGVKVRAASTVVF